MALPERSLISITAVSVAIFASLIIYYIIKKLQSEEKNTNFQSSDDKCLTAQKPATQSRRLELVCRTGSSVDNNDVTDDDPGGGESGYATSLRDECERSYVDQAEGGQIKDSLKQSSYRHDADDERGATGQIFYRNNTERGSLARDSATRRQKPDDFVHDIEAVRNNWNNAFVENTLSSSVDGRNSRVWAGNNVGWDHLLTHTPGSSVDEVRPTGACTAEHATESRSDSRDSTLFTDHTVSPDHQPFQDVFQSVHTDSCLTTNEQQMSYRDAIATSTPIESSMQEMTYSALDAMVMSDDFVHLSTSGSDIQDNLLTSAVIIKEEEIQSHNTKIAKTDPADDDNNDEGDDEGDDEDVSMREVENHRLYESDSDEESSSHHVSSQSKRTTTTVDEDTTEITGSSEVMATAETSCRSGSTGSPNRSGRSDSSFGGGLPGVTQIREALLVASTNPQGLQIEHARTLVELLPCTDPSLQHSVLNVITKCAAFTSNQSLLREAGCVTMLSQLLFICSEPVLVAEESYTGDMNTLMAITNCLTNIAVSEDNQKLMGGCVDILITLFLKPSVPERIHLSCLQALTNLSVLGNHHAEYKRIVSQLYSELDGRANLRLQCLKVLVNLSCNEQMVPHLLAAKAPDCYLDLLSPPAEESLMLRWVTLIANIMRSVKVNQLTIAELPPGDKAASPETMHSALYGIATANQIKSKVFLLNKHHNDDIALQSTRVYTTMSSHD